MYMYALTAGFDGLGFLARFWRFLRIGVYIYVHIGLWLKRSNI